MFGLDFFEDFFFELLLLLLVVLPIVGDGISSSRSLVSIGDESFRLLIVVASAWEEFECDSCNIKHSVLFDLDFRLLFDLLRFVFVVDTDGLIESPFVFVAREVFDDWREFTERDVWRLICYKRKKGKNNFTIFYLKLR